MSLVLNNGAQFSVLLGLNTFFSWPVQKYLVTLTLASALVSHFKVLRQSFLCYGQGAVRRAILYGDRSCFTVIRYHMHNLRVRQ